MQPPFAADASALGNVDVFVSMRPPSSDSAAQTAAKSPPRPPTPAPLPALMAFCVVFLSPAFLSLSWLTSHSRELFFHKLVF